MTATEAYIAFNLTDRIGSVGVGESVREFGDVVTAWENYPKKVSRSGGPIDWEGELKLAAKFGVTILTPADEDYPRQLLEVAQHPLCLYVKGDVKALSKPAVAVVGTRRATPYGTDQANRFGFALAQAGWMVLSGLALGIDAEAHRGALAAGGTTVGVIGSGLDRFYPEQNRELAREIVNAGGAVVSQFPFGREPDKETFPIRNQVVAALSRGVLAVECPVKSGTLITTSLAADLGRTVMALPSRVDSRAGAGCLKLIRDGAVLVRHVDDINEALSELIPASSMRRGKDSAAPVEGERRGKDSAAPVEGERRGKDSAVEGERRGKDSAAPVEGEWRGRDSAVEGERRGKDSAAPVEGEWRGRDSAVEGECRGRDSAVEGETRRRKAESRLPEVTLEESVVLRHLDEDGISLEKLVVKTGFPAAKLGSVCMALRLKGRLRYLPGNRVSLPRSV